MKNQIARLLFTLTCSAFVARAGLASETDPKPERKMVRAKDGLNLVCEVRGKGDTALVFLHGWCGDHEYWKNQAAVFAADYRVVTVDQAGHGQSGTNRSAWTINSLAQDVESIVNALGLKRVILVGHSMSGQISLLAAKRMPGKVIAVIGVDTLQNAEFKMPEDVSKQFLDKFAADFKGAMRETFPGLLHEQTPAEVKNWLITKAEAQNQTMALALFRDLSQVDLKTLMKEANVPIRCINSAGPFPFFTPTAVDINRKYADYNAVLIEGVGHYPMLEKPSEFNQKLQNTLKEFATKK